LFSTGFRKYADSKYHRREENNVTEEVNLNRCTFCGYVYEGLDPLEFCPVCGALREEFDPVVELRMELTE
jgi:rubrerythrin